MNGRLQPDDPTLAPDGHLELPAELEALADTLRRQSQAISDRSLPAASFARLMERLQCYRHPTSLPHGRRWRKWWLPTSALALCALSALLIIRPFAWLPSTRPSVDRSDPLGRGAAVPSPDASPAADSPAPAGTPETFAASGSPAGPSVFLSVTDPLKGGEDGAAVTDAERIILLENALEAYRAALVAQQQRIAEAESALRDAQREISRLRQALSRSSASPDSERVDSPPAK